MQPALWALAVLGFLAGVALILERVPDLSDKMVAAIGGIGRVKDAVAELFENNLNDVAANSAFDSAVKEETQKPLPSADYVDQRHVQGDESKINEK